MHVVEPARYKERPKHHRRKRYAVIPLVIITVIGAFNYLRPLSAATTLVHIAVPPAGTANISWPANGQASIAAGGYGLLDTSGTQTPLATGSAAKVITALCVLQKEPLSPGQSGPTYTAGPQDVRTYQNYAARDESLIPVQQGEKITEYQALEALMIPSADNIADSLVRWIFGDQQTYAAYAGAFLQQHGMNNTHIGSDASGFDPSTTSTAGDLAQLGLAALQSPVLMQIAGQHSVYLPIAGTVANYNTALGQNGITGLKTGDSSNDSGVFIFTAATRVGGKTIPLAGAVMGAPSLDTALTEGVRLAGSFEHSFEQVTLAETAQPVGIMRTTWGTSASVVTASAVRLVRWQATPVTVRSRVDTATRQGVVGTLKVTAGPAGSQTKLKVARPLAGPPLWWRLTRR